MAGEGFDPSEHPFAPTSRLGSAARKRSQGWAVRPTAEGGALQGLGASTALGWRSRGERSDSAAPCPSFPPRGSVAFNITAHHAQGDHAWPAYDLVAVAGGFRHPTRPAYADGIRNAFGTAVEANGRAVDLTQSDVLVLMCIAYFQPITRAELSSFLGKEISRDQIGHLRGSNLIASGPRSSGSPYTYVTTKAFLLEVGLNTLRDLADFEALEDAGLPSKEKVLAGDIMPGLEMRMQASPVMDSMLLPRCRVRPPCRRRE